MYRLQERKRLIPLQPTQIIQQILPLRIRHPVIIHDLAIVKTCVEACGGTVSCRNRKPTGLEVILRLQAAR
jgi:hypothetical protein